VIDFLKYRSFYAAISFLIFAVFIGDYAYKFYTRGYAFTYSVDFTGGTQVLLGFSQPISSAEIIHPLENAGIKGIDTREFSPTEVLVRAASFSNAQEGVGDTVQRVLQEAFPSNKVVVKKVDSIGGGIGESLRWKSIQAVVIALILMLLYIAFRFWSFAFAAGVVVSLFHDAIVILAYFLLFDKEISLNVIAAIVSVLGYSINDTIVIFARIRENIPKLPNKSMDEIVNISMNETLRRTLLTSFATTLVVVSLLIFGGEALGSLAQALFIGIVFGTYSSIYIASPVMLMLQKNKK
jgi:preprotein translocase subunit SecF